MCFFSSRKNKQKAHHKATAEESRPSIREWLPGRSITYMNLDSIIAYTLLNHRIHSKKYHLILTHTIFSSLYPMDQANEYLGNLRAQHANTFDVSPSLAETSLDLFYLKDDKLVNQDLALLLDKLRDEKDQHVVFIDVEARLSSLMFGSRVAEITDLVNKSQIFLVSLKAQSNYRKRFVKYGVEMIRGVMRCRNIIRLITVCLFLVLFLLYMIPSSTTTEHFVLNNKKLSMF